MAYTDKTFLAKIKPLVIDDMRKTGILASLTAAQAFVESAKGNSGLTSKANNMFGIKGSYNGQSVTMLTTEYYNGIPVKVYAAFRKYPSWVESISDHSGLFNRLARYKNLRGETDYVKACNNVQADGYATSPTYSTTLLTHINKYNLYEWDGEAMGRIVPRQKVETIAQHYPTLLIGSKSDYVLHWQKYLNLLGFACGNEDGVFGANTRAAVMEYQRSKGLAADGIIGAKTWESTGL